MGNVPADGTITVAEPSHTGGPSRRRYRGGGWRGEVRDPPSDVESAVFAWLTGREVRRLLLQRGKGAVPVSSSYRRQEMSSSFYCIVGRRRRFVPLAPRRVAFRKRRRIRFGERELAPSFGSVLDIRFPLVVCSRASGTRQSARQGFPAANYQ